MSFGYQVLGFGGSGTAAETGNDNGIFAYGYPTSPGNVSNLVSNLGVVATDTAAVVVGIFGRYMLPKTGQDPETILGIAGENVLAMLLNLVMPTVIIGVYIATVLSAVMSTVDSLLVVASSAVTRDFYQQIICPDIDEKWLMSLNT